MQSIIYARNLKFWENNPKVVVKRNIIAVNCIVIVGPPYWGVILGPFWELWNPLVGPPGFLILVYYFVLLPKHKISVMIMTICCQSGLDGSTIEKIQDFAQF